MQATSRESTRVVRERLDEQVSRADDDTLRRLGDELASVAALLASERVLRKHLADSSTSESSRAELARRLFGEKVGEVTMALAEAVVRSRWSRANDMLDAFELLARLAVLTLAERDGTAEEVEDELFRFGRIVESEPRLQTLLGDQTIPAAKRRELLDSLLADKVKPVTRQLLEQVVTAPRGRHVDAVVAELAKLAAARRDESVALVTSAAELTDQQEQRLTDVLSRIYQRRIAIRVEVDPDLIGGLVIRVGDEVIDGSVAAKLAKARQELLG
jgi:F-type H+-transporting ATPase subunit delta